MNRISTQILRSPWWVRHSLLLVLLLVLATMPAHAVVTLVSFTATAGDGQVLLRWETATEINNAGFFVRRNSQEAGEYVRISPFIPSRGDSLIGDVYTYLDTDVQNGITYFYELEAMGNDQDTEFHGPISATPGGTPTPTLTPIPSPTATATLAPTATPTLTATHTPPVPTHTPSPTLAARPTDTPTPVPTPIPTDTPEPTPFPTVALTDTPAPVLTPAAPPTPAPIHTPSPTSTMRPTDTPASASVPTGTQTPSPALTMPPTQTATVTPTESQKTSPAALGTPVKAHPATPPSSPPIIQPFPLPSPTSQPPLPTRTAGSPTPYPGPALALRPTVSAAPSTGRGAQGLEQGHLSVTSSSQGQPVGENPTGNPRMWSEDWGVLFGRGLLSLVALGVAGGLFVLIRGKGRR